MLEVEGFQSGDSAEIFLLAVDPSLWLPLLSGLSYILVLIAPPCILSALSPQLFAGSFDYSKDCQLRERYRVSEVIAQRGNVNVKAYAESALLVTSSILQSSMVDGDRIRRNGHLFLGVAARQVSFPKPLGRVHRHAMQGKLYKK